MKTKTNLDRLTFATPAKLNLFLELHAKRCDGFHELETIMCKWSLFDWLTMERAADERVNLTVEQHQRLGDAEIPTDDRNLVSKALRLMQRRAGESLGMLVRLFKNIPLQAGLGGASSNAAAAIVGANRLWGLDWPFAQLESVAGEIGSDVAFFLRSAWARCTGRGERVQNLNYRCRLNVAVVKPAIGLSTGQIYARSAVPSQPISSDTILASIHSGHAPNIGRAMFNRLELFAEDGFYDLARIRAAFEKTGCLGHQMTGSGSCYFGIYPTVKSMRIAGKRLAAQLPGMSVITGQTLGSRNIDSSID